MSDPNAFDDSYGTPQRKPGGFPIIWIVLIGVAIFVFMQSQVPQNQPGETGQGDENVAIEEPAHRKARTDRGDWSMEEVETTDSNETAGRPMPRDKATSRNRDWSIEEVDTGGDDPVAGTSKKTNKGDWSIEEVEVDGSEDDSVQLRTGDRTEKSPSKTKKGDWEIDVE